MSDAAEAALYRRLAAVREALEALTTFVGRTPNSVDATGTINDRAIYDAYCAASRAIENDARADEETPNGWKSIAFAPRNELILLFCPTAPVTYQMRIGSLVCEPDAPRESGTWYSQSETLADAEKITPSRWMPLLPVSAPKPETTTQGVKKSKTA